MGGELSGIPRGDIGFPRWTDCSDNDLVVQTVGSNPLSEISSILWVRVFNTTDIIQWSSFITNVLK